MANADPLPQNDHRARQRQLDQSRIDTFVVRARRIASHSLARDGDRLMRLSGGEMKVAFRDGKASVRFDYPPEEQIESAAARVRPLLLDDVSMPSVLKAIKSLTADSDERERIRAWARQRRQTWDRRTGKVLVEPGYVALIHSTETGESGSADQIQLALAWIYGDVVHHDRELLNRTKLWGVGERFRGAVPLVAYLMVESIGVLMTIRELEKRGILTVSPEAWSVPVVAEEHYEREANIYLAEIGTEAPDNATDPPGPGWTPFDPGTFVPNDADEPSSD